MKKLFLFLMLLALPAHSMVYLIETLTSGYVDSSGNQLDSGTVTFYSAGTTSSVTCYSDFEKLNALANPATLDASGKLDAWCDDRVKLLIKDSDGLTVNTIDDVGVSDTDVSGAVSDILAGDGLVTGDDGAIAVNFDDSSLEASSDILQVKDNGITSAHLSTFLEQSVPPVGTVLDYAGSTEPSGWLFCDGTAVSRTTYARLFALIGETYGAGDSSTTFNVPDARGRAAIGRDNMGGSAANRLESLTAEGEDLGEVGGADTHTLIDAELSSHSHTGTTGNQSANHTHTTTIEKSGSNTGVVARSSAGDSGGGANGHVSGNQSASHTHSFTSATTGSDTAHNNLQPLIIFNKIIKY